MIVKKHDRSLRVIKISQVRQGYLQQFHQAHNKLRFRDAIQGIRFFQPNQA